MKKKGLHPKIPAALAPVAVVAAARIEQTGTVDTFAGLLILVVVVGVIAAYFTPAGELEPIETTVARVVAAVGSGPVTVGTVAAAVGDQLPPDAVAAATGVVDASSAPVASPAVVAALVPTDPAPIAQ